MRTIIAAVAALVAGHALAADRLPNFPKRTTYEEARTSLQALGWRPVAQSPTRCEGTECGLARCLDGDDRCKPYPETEICRGTGRASCEFVWRRGETIIQVTSVGEDAPVTVDGIHCRAGCR